MSRSSPGRALAIFTIGFLLLDAVLLIWAGLETSRRPLVWGGMTCLVAAGVIVQVWRKYRSTLDDISVRRREMKSEVEAIRDLLRERNEKN